MLGTGDYLRGSRDLPVGSYWMRVARILGLFLASQMFLSVPARAEDTPVPALEKALAEPAQGSARRALVRELKGAFELRDRGMRTAALGWMQTHRGSLADGEYRECVEYYVKVNPDDPWAWGLKDMLADDRLKAMPRSERVRIYMAAVRNGEVGIGRSYSLKMPEALGAAAWQGLEEFLPEIESRKAELGEAPEAPGVSLADMLLWELRLRAGAETETEANAAHVKSLEEMGADRFARLMAEDPAFRALNAGFARTSCAGPLKTSERCRAFGRLYVRQRSLMRKEALASRKDLVEPRWLQEWEAWTERARLEARLEELARQKPAEEGVHR